MHFNEAYVLDATPDLPLEQVLMRNPASRRVRWQPGTRMSYSNPGYGVAGLVVEKVSGTPFDEFVEERIFRPLEMPTSSFRLAPDDDAALARGYAAAHRPAGDRTGASTCGPAGALHTSPAELAHFVQALLGWGERGPAGYVVDPEYLSNMEWPRTTLAVDGRRARRLRARHLQHDHAAVPRPRPQRRHRRVPVGVRLLAVARRRLRGAASIPPTPRRR